MGGALPGRPSDGDAVGRVDAEGEHVVHHARLLDGRSAAAAGRRCVEVGVEGAAVQLHLVQDGHCQPLHHFFCRSFHI